MQFEVGTVVDLTHNLTGNPVKVTALIVSHEPASQQVVIAPIKRAGLMVLSESLILSCELNTSIKFSYDPPVQDSDTIHRNFNQNVIDRQSKAEKLQSNASQLAKYLFASIDKSMGCQWEGETIVVENTIRILPPYTQDSCQGNSVTALARVKRMVNNLNASFESSE